MLKYISLTLLLLVMGCSNTKSVECSYASTKTDKQNSEFSPQGECGILVDEDTLLLYPEHFKNLDFSKSNLSTIYGGGRVFYVAKSGKVVHSFLFDNGADYFKEGLSRMIVKKKIGFVNEQLETIIEPKFDFAYPFEDGKSMVCQGCKEVKESDGEHTMIVSGKWGVIDKKGETVLPLKYMQKEIYKKLSEL